MVTKKKKLGNLQTLGTEKNKHLMKVQQSSRKIISHIEKLKDEASTSIEREYEEIEQELKADTSSITEALEKLEKCGEHIYSLENLSQTQQFVQEKVNKQFLADVEKLTISNKHKKTKSIQCMENEELIETIIAATFLVTTEERKETEIRQRKESLKIKSKKEVNVKEKDDGGTCSIAGICQLPDGTVILADYTNRKLKILGNDYKVKDHCDLGGGPSGVCCFGKTEVAVKVGVGKDGKIQFIHVGATLSKTSSFDIEGGGHYGMSFFANKFWVNTGSGISIYDVSGTKLVFIDKSFSKEISESSINIFPAGADSTSLFISDCDGSVARVNGYRNVTKVFSDKRLRLVRSVSCYPDGTLFLAGYFSNNIVMFSKDGQCLGELISAKDDIREIHVMCFDNKRKRLLVGCLSDNNLHVLELFD